jgi:hypothetical protein
MVLLCGWRDQRTLGHLKHCNRVLAEDTGELIQKVIERMTRFQITIRPCTGTRVPAKTGVPPRRSRVLVINGSGSKTRLRKGPQNIHRRVRGF